MRNNIRSVLFVCTGNSCRSIMAEAYLNKRLKEEGFPIEVWSAGTFGMDGFVPTKEVLELLAEEGISADGYRSKPLTEDAIRRADVILVMEPSHRAKILGMVPEADEKVRFLGEFSGNTDGVMIPDPIGRPMAFYKTSFNVIKRSTEGFIKWLKASL